MILSEPANGEEQGKLFDRYKDKIQEYIMTGHEKGWKYCDILSANSFSHESEPHISMDLSKIKTLNIKKTFASSSCLLVNYHVSGNISLATLFDFGWAAIQHVRLALVVNMSSGITLDMITNTTKLPFLIAAELEQGREQFLCPIVGEINSILEENLCKPSYASFKKKRLRVALLGIPPYFMVTNTGQIDGTDIRLLRILEQKLNFGAEITVPQSYLEADTKVCDDYISKSK